MNLKSFGCSFIFGTDLHDDGRNGPYATASNHTWPALLAKHQGWTYSCHAKAGSGNLLILERLLDQLAMDQSPAFYVVGWSWIDRFDHYDDTESAAWFKWKTIMPVDTTSLADTYYRKLHSQYRDKLTTLIHIKTAVDLLQQHGHKFLMTHMDDLIFESQWHCPPGIASLQAAITPHIKKFEDQTFLDWSKEKGFEISPTMHPLETAHAAAAEYAINHFLV
jgi:hypothetical protein